MPILSDSELVKSIRSGKVLPCYFLWGKDTAAVDIFAKKLCAKLLPLEDRDLNYHYFNGNAFPLSEFADICESLPMFAQRVLVVVSDLNAENLKAEDTQYLTEILSNIDPETTTVVFYASNIDLTGGKKGLTAKNKKLADHISKIGGAVTEFALKRPSELVKHIQARLKESEIFIAPQQAEYLASILNCNLLNINTECDKLAAYCHGRNVEQADIEELVVGAEDTDAYRLASAVVFGKSGEAFSILNRLYQKQDEPIPLLAVIAGSITDLYRAKIAYSAGSNANEVIEAFKYGRRDFVVKNAFRDIHKMSLEKLRYCLLVLSDTDISLKSSRTDQKILLEQAIVKMITYNR